MRTGLCFLLSFALSACAGDPVCGDGDLWLNTEECDDGNQRDGDGCDENCRLATGVESIIGSWRFSDGDVTGTMRITRERWSGAAISRWDEADRIVIVQASQGTEPNPGSYAKIVYTEVVDYSFYFCVVASGKETVEDALMDRVVANAENPGEEGCANFDVIIGGTPWMHLTRILETEGEGDGSADEE